MKFVSLLLILFTFCVHAETLIHDDFVDEKLKSRLPARGDWKLEDKAISANFDEELFKKYKNHGPIVWYNHEAVTDCDIELEYFVTGGVDTVMFSVNDAKGHVYRTTIKTEGSRKGAYTKGWTAKKKASLAGKLEGFDLEENKWVAVKLSFKGNKLSLTIGDKTQEYEHDAFAREKTKFNFQFSKGMMKVRNLKISKS